MKKYFIKGVSKDIETLELDFVFYNECVNCLFSEAEPNEQLYLESMNNDGDIVVQGHLISSNFEDAQRQLIEINRRLVELFQIED